MKIDGKQIAYEILNDLKKRVTIPPHLVIILLGHDPASVSYVRQKELKAAEIGAKATVIRLESGIENQELREIIKELNEDSEVHGIIVQRPLPQHIDSQGIDELVAQKKDIDAFRSDSPYEMPLAGAVIKILEKIHASTPEVEPRNFFEWLKSQNIVVVGKGKTGGGPTISLLRKMNIEPHVIDSKTTNPDQILKNADIVISTIGKPNIVKAENLKKGVIVIGVGMHRGEDGKLHPDYTEEEIESVASYYTPVPGGVGPVNVAILLKNLVDAAKI